MSEYIDPYDDPAYREFEKDAQKDSRVGKHDFMVSEVNEDTWPSGDPRVKIRGVLLTANNAKADLTISPPPPPEVIKSESAGWQDGKKKAISNTIAMYRNLAKFYGKRPEQMAAGEVYRVQTAKSRVDPKDGTGGFIRIIQFLDKSQVTEAGKDASQVPF